MDLQDIMLCEISQTEIQVSYDCTYMLNLKNKMNKTKLEIDSQIREQTDG